MTEVRRTTPEEREFLMALRRNSFLWRLRFYYREIVFGPEAPHTLRGLSWWARVLFR